jgi:hypothetical protein
MTTDSRVFRVENDALPRSLLANSTAQWLTAMEPNEAEDWWRCSAAVATEDAASRFHVWSTSLTSRSKI